MSLAAFKKAIAEFNYANKAGSYAAVEQYLSTSSPCLIHRVDHGSNDVDNPLKGTPEQVVAGLKTSQADKGSWPTLAYDESLLTDRNKVVSGPGKYRDKGDVPASEVPVSLEYHFDDADKIVMVNVVKKPSVPEGNYTLGPPP